MDRRAIGTLSVGHGGVDFASGAIPSLIPFLVVEFDLGYAAVGALMLAPTAASPRPPGRSQSAPRRSDQ